MFDNYGQGLLIQLQMLSSNTFFQTCGTSKLFMFGIYSQLQENNAVELAVELAKQFFLFGLKCKPIIMYKIIKSIEEDFFVIITVKLLVIDSSIIFPHSSPTVHVVPAKPEFM